MITSLIEIAKLPNFGQMAKSTIKFVLRIKICWWCLDTNYDIFNSKFLFLRKPRVNIFADIIKILTIFIEKIYKGLKKVKRIRNCVSKRNICIIWFILLVFSEKMQISTELKKCVPIHIFSGFSLGNI